MDIEEKRVRIISSKGFKMVRRFFVFHLFGSIESLRFEHGGIKFGVVK